MHMEVRLYTHTHTHTHTHTQTPCMRAQVEISSVMQRRTRETNAAMEAHSESQIAHARLEAATQLLRSVATQCMQLVADTVCVCATC